MAIVSPSILAADFAHLAADCEQVYRDDNHFLHFDVMDGHFVPNLSIGVPVLQSLHKALPAFTYDVHLMITDPMRYIEPFAQAGADYITFHVEAEGDPAKTARAIRTLGKKAGISLRPGTSIDTLFPLLSEVDLVLVMSVEPGFGGQAFMPEAPSRIQALRQEAQRQDTSLLIEVDGGIDAQTGRLCTQAGADILVAGSAIFSAAEPQQVLQGLMAL